MDAKTFVSLLIEKLQDLLTKEAITANPSFVREVETAVHSLKRQNQSLGDSEDQCDILSVLPAVYSAQDVIDSLLNRKEFRLQPTRNEGIKGFKKVFQYPFMCFKSSHSQDLFTLQAEKFRNEVRALSSHGHSVDKNEAETLSIIEDVLSGSNNDAIWEGQQGQQQLLKKISEYCGKDQGNVVGPQQIKELVDLLFSDKKSNKSKAPSIREDQHDGHDSTIQVVAVVGEAGSGKSTLVRTLYNTVRVDSHFKERAWLRVSSESKARDVLLGIVEQLSELAAGTSQYCLAMLETLSEEELKRCLASSLKEYAFLIVIEDVEKPQVWRAVRDALNDFSCHHGKIIITSRNPNATSQADSTLLMRPLNDDESWELFSKKVQLTKDHAFTRTFKEKILEVCRGVPLRIDLLGGLLFAKGQNEHEWSRVIEITNKSNGDLLALSYQDLPSQVKPCFLYMGLFPKGYEIPIRRLIHLWCAEGFVSSSNSKEIVPEDLAGLYFQELVTRNMIQVRSRLDGSPKICRMHDLLHDTFSQRAADAGFFYCDQFQSSHALMKQPQFAVRRLAAAYLGNHNFPSSSIDLRNLRSCIVFDPRVQGTPAREICGFLKKVIGKRDFGLLKVLDLEGVYKPTLADAFEKLLQLRYLGLRSTFIDSLPDSVDKLLHLETLDLKHTKIRNLPPSIWKAKKLQHLYLDWSHSGILADSSFSKSLSKLHTLWGLCIKDDNNGMYDFQGNFTRLRKLGLTCFSTSMLKIINQLTGIQSLKVKYAGKEFGLHLQLQSFERHDKLQELYLMGQLQKPVIDAGFLPPNLRVLTLSQSGLLEDPMSVLEQLPHLTILRLFAGSYIGNQMTCSRGGFPELRVLKLWKLDRLGNLLVTQGAMPCLRELEIRDCDNVCLPEGLRHLKTLKELVVTGSHTRGLWRRENVESILGNKCIYRKCPWTSQWYIPTNSNIISNSIRLLL